jgi:hypothetical protein
MSMVWGRRIDPANLARLVDDALATIAEFGEPGDDVQALTNGPLADPDARRGFADNAVVLDSQVGLTDIPGIGFEGKAAFYKVLKALHD